MDVLAQGYAHTTLGQLIALILLVTKRICFTEEQFMNTLMMKIKLWNSIYQNPL